MRPFYFGVVLWGEEFRGYFLDFCLPSLLAPRNIPALENKTGSRFLICTTADDWAAMGGHPVFQSLAKEIEPVLIEMKRPADGASKMRAMSEGHAVIAQTMHRDGVYGSFVYPDTVFANGVVEEAQSLAKRGKKVVLANCPRFANEGFLSALAARGIRRTGQPIILNPDELISLAMPHMHSETRRYEWEAPHFYSRSPVAIWWRVPGGGLLMHSTCWAPILVDYSRLGTHDTSTMRDWTIDGDYIHRNFPDRRDVHASETMTLISFTPESRLSYLPLKRLRTDYVPFVNRWFKEANLRSFLFSRAMDPLKRELFTVPLRMGVADPSETSAVEAVAADLFARCSRPIGRRVQQVLDLLWIVNEGIGLNFGWWLKQRRLRMTSVLASLRIPRSGESS